MRAVLALAMAAALLGSGAVAQDGDLRQITVTGEGRVAAAPDMATISLGVVDQARTAEAAMTAVSQAMRRVLGELTAAAIDERDIQTSGLRLNPIYNSQPNQQVTPEITAFVARNGLTVRVRDLDELGAVLDVALRSGANEFSGLSFSIQEPDAARDEARRRAVTEALRKAELYAEAAGVTLGPLVRLSEAGSGSPMPRMMDMAAASADAIPIAPGEVSVSASVTMVYEIRD